jgi:hypothetical protein
LTRVLNTLTGEELPEFDKKYNWIEPDILMDYIKKAFNNINND